MAPTRTASPAASLALAAKTLLDTMVPARPFLQDWPEFLVRRRAEPRRLPVLDWLDAAQPSPATAPLVRAIVDHADALSWQQTYGAADFGAAFLDRYGWTEFIGLRGPIPSTELACGLLMLGPNIEYPAHAHEAEELYLPLAGSASWMRGDEGHALRPVGVPIHHPPWMPHAMRTQSEPLLALYVWRGGDLAAKSKIMEQH